MIRPDTRYAKSVGGYVAWQAFDDSHWLEVRAAHDTIVRRNLAAFRGREVECTGDQVRSLGVEIRAGVHTGEIERRPHEIGGIAVNLASRVLSLAHSGEVLVSGTVTDLVVGAGIRFEDRGVQALKGIPGSWRICAKSGAAEA